MENAIIPSVLYHYTRLENLQNIIRTGDKGVELVFWLTHFRQLNDAAEGAALDKTIADLIPEWGINPIPDMYVLSLCGSKENLPLWKEYANDAKGIAIALDSNIILNNTADLKKEIVKCEYGETENLNAIRQSIKDLDLYIESDEGKARIANMFNYERFPELRNYPHNRWILKMGEIKRFFKPLLAFKAPCYYYEDEYRLTVDGFYAERIKYHVKGDRLIEYREYHIDIKALKGIYLGSNNTEDTAEYIRRFIRNFELKQDVMVNRVDLPYRTY